MSNSSVFDRENRTILSELNAKSFVSPVSWPVVLTTKWVRFSLFLDATLADRTTLSEKFFRQTTHSIHWSLLMTDLLSSNGRGMECGLALLFYWTVEMVVNHWSSFVCNTFVIGLVNSLRMWTMRKMKLIAILKSSPISFSYNYSVGSREGKVQKHSWTISSEENVRKFPKCKKGKDKRLSYMRHLWRIS